MTTFLRERERIVQYGLPFSTNYGRSFVYVVESAIARHYLLESKLCALTELQRFRGAAFELEIEQREHMVRLAHFLIDYFIIIACGEARHFSTSSGGSCPLCRQYITKTRISSREEAANAIPINFKGYKEAFYVLNHTFNQHAWQRSYGGWKWGNITYCASMLYNAIEHQNWEQLKRWLDLVCQLEHNGGSVFLDRLQGISFNNLLLNYILGAKFHNKPCCVKFLEYVSNPMNCWTYGDTAWCAHLYETRVPNKLPMLFPGGVKLAFCLRGNHECSADTFNGKFTSCKNWCPTCGCGGCSDKSAIITDCYNCNKFKYTDHWRVLCTTYCKYCKTCTQPTRFSIVSMEHPRCHACNSAGPCACRVQQRMSGMYAAWSLYWNSYTTEKQKELWPKWSVHPYEKVWKKDEYGEMVENYNYVTTSTPNSEPTLELKCICCCLDCHNYAKLDDCPVSSPMLSLVNTNGDDVDADSNTELSNDE